MIYRILVRYELVPPINKGRGFDLEEDGEFRFMIVESRYLSDSPLKYVVSSYVSLSSKARDLCWKCI